MQRGCIVLALLLLAACGGSDRPVYSGHEENTKGVPGFNYAGQKMHPNVKLGQSYTVNGVTYVPRYQPDYDEEGLASWYGPGFHGGRTANGETFSTNDFTAAHPTLPLPSIVKVTNQRNGQWAYVRVNDRGPYAKGRIIDLSRAAAEKIDLIRDGVGKVRVQYMPNETEKFVELMEQGRAPDSIDIADEVIGQTPAHPTQYAQATVQAAPVAEMTMASNMPPPKQDSGAWWDVFNPISTAEASPAPQAHTPQELMMAQAGPAPVQPEIVIAPPDAAPANMISAPTPVVQEMQVQPVQPASPPVIAQPTVTQIVPKAAPGMYIQLGAFSLESNAKALQSRVASLGTSYIMPKPAGGATLYRVRMGPFISDGAAQEMLARVDEMGIAGATIVHE